MYLGSPNYPDEISLQEAIDSFYKSGELPHFNDEKIASDRKKVIVDTIQWDDGLNHVRAGNEIIRILESGNMKRVQSVPMEIKLHKFKQKLINSLKIKKSVIYQRSHAFNQEEVSTFSNMLYGHQMDLYNSLGLTKESLKEIKVI